MFDIEMITALTFPLFSCLFNYAENSAFFMPAAIKKVWNQTRSRPVILMKVTEIEIGNLILSFQSVDERQYLRDILIRLYFVKTL